MILKVWELQLWAYNVSFLQAGAGSLHELIQPHPASVPEQEDNEQIHFPL